MSLGSKLTASRRNNRKAKDEEGRRQVDISSGTDERGRLAFAGDASNSGEIKSGGGGGVVEWTTTVARPMSAWSYPDDEEPGVGNVRKRPRPEETASEDEEVDTGEEQVKVAVTQAKGSSSTSTTARTTSTLPTTTQLPPPSQDTSMEAREYHEIYSSSSLLPCTPAILFSRSDHQRESCDLWSVRSFRVAPFVTPLPMDMFTGTEARRRTLGQVIFNCSNRAATFSLPSPFLSTRRSSPRCLVRAARDTSYSARSESPLRGSLRVENDWSSDLLLFSL